MSRFTKLMILVLTICLCAAAVSAQPDPIVITSGQLNETRTDTTLTMFGPGSLTVSLEIPNPSWFGIQQPGELGEPHRRRFRSVHRGHPNVRRNHLFGQLFRPDPVRIHAQYAYFSPRIRKRHALRAPGDAQRRLRRA